MLGSKQAKLAVKCLKTLPQGSIDARIASRDRECFDRVDLIISRAYHPVRLSALTGLVNFLR